MTVRPQFPKEHTDEGEFKLQSGENGGQSTFPLRVAGFAPAS
jgi:hypothetical protein